MFGELGCAGVALEDLTALAGMTRGASYHHFGKLGLFKAVVSEAVDSNVTANMIEGATDGLALWACNIADQAARADATHRLLDLTLASLVAGRAGVGD